MVGASLVAPKAGGFVMRSVLMIAFLFPPRRSVGGKRPLRFARYLPACGWRPVILAGPAGTAAENDESLLASVPHDLRVERDYAPSWLWSLRNLGGRLDERLRPKSQARNRDDSATSRPTAGGAAELLAGLADRFVPMDGNLIFRSHAVGAGARLIEQEKIDALYVTGYPFSAFLVGAELKQRYGLPLICELRDPWTLNVQFADRHPRVAAFERRMEARVFERSDRVVVTTDTLRDAYARLYPDLPADRFRRIYSPYDEEQAPPTPRESPPLPAGSPLTVIHFGSFYGPRRAACLLRALARLRDRRRLRASDLLLRIYGRLDAPEDHRAVRDLGLQDSVAITKPAPYAEGVAALRAADVLYLPAFGTETFYIPGKMYDYFLAGRPILCETASPEMEAMMDRTGAGKCVPVGDEDGMLHFLEKALDARGGGPPVTRPIRAEIERFSAPAVTRELGALLDEVVA